MATAKGSLTRRKPWAAGRNCKSAPAPADSDGDGMPDEWEVSSSSIRRTLPTAPQDKDEDGYTNLEEYLNGTDPTVFVDYTMRW